MTEEQLKILREEVALVVRATVNGKIDKIDVKLTQHIMDNNSFQEEIKPYIQGMTGLGVLWKILIGLGSIFLIWTQIRQFFTIKL